VADDGSSINPSEQKLRDVLKGRLGTYATITKVKQTGDHIEARWYPKMILIGCENFNGSGSVGGAANRLQSRREADN